jgi:hypothetical protein
MQDWIQVVARCQECNAMWADSLPIDWDGTPISCRMCGETCSVEVGK